MRTFKKGLQVDTSTVPSPSHHAATYPDTRKNRDWNEAAAAKSSLTVGDAESRMERDVLYYFGS